MQSIDVGSTSSKRTILLPYNARGEENKGFTFEIMFNEDENIFTATIVKKMSLLELIAFILATMVGFIMIARVMKTCLGDSE